MTPVTPGGKTSRNISAGSGRAPSKTPATPSSGKQSTSLTRARRTITFDEVYQGGNAQYKHAIITHPTVAPGTWYIVKCECEDHAVHFGGPRSVLQGAAKHLDTAVHQIPRSHKAAIEYLGWEVLGCDLEKATANNAVFEEALRNGYVPLNTRNGRGCAGGAPTVVPARLRSTFSATASVEPTPTTDARVTRAKGGELYYAWWKSDQKYYLCMIIPWDNSESFGLTEFRKGIHGLGLLNKHQACVRVPKCYKVDYDADPPMIAGWSEGYEDGGKLESKRTFPTLFFHPP